jgi:hypothetical protein
MYYGTPPIVTNGLVLNLDAQSPQSIPNDPTVNQAQSPFIFTAGYAYGNVTASNNTTINYDGTLTAGTLSTPQSTYYARTSGYNPPIAYGKKYATSWLLKYANVTNITLNWGGIHSGNRTNFNFNLQTGVISGVSLASGENYGSYDLGNGWYQVWYTSTTPTTGSNLYYPQLTLTSGSVFIGGIQIEMNNYATPFTTSSRTSWYDLSGNNNIATLQSSSISGSIPVFPAANNRVLQFDGTSSFASIPNSSNLVFGNGDFTVGMWIKTPISSVGEGSPSQWGPIISKGCTTSAPAGTWWFAQNSTNNNRITFNISSTIGSEFVCSLTTPTLVDGWHNVVFTRSGSTGTLYTDGVRSSIDTTTDSDLFSTAPIYLGSTSPRPQKKTGMGLSQVQIYNRTLSQAEITQNYNALKSRFGLQ